MTEDRKTVFDIYPASLQKDGTPMIHCLKSLDKGGKSLDIQEWVNVGGKKVLMRVEMKARGKTLEVLTAHPIPKVHP